MLKPVKVPPYWRNRPRTPAYLLRVGGKTMITEADGSLLYKADVKRCRYYSALGRAR